MSAEAFCWGAAILIGLLMLALIGGMPEHPNQPPPIAWIRKLSAPGAKQNPARSKRAARR
jgi:hypothetical protein